MRENGLIGDKAVADVDVGCSELNLGDDDGDDDHSDEVKPSEHPHTNATPEAVCITCG